jgi:hypothetical protein
MGLEDPGLWLSIVATFVAAFAAFAGYAVYREQADPEVIVYAEGDSQRVNIINLVVENIGRSPAKNVSFKASGDLPSKVGLGGDGSGDSALMTTGPLVRGIPFLPPGGKRVVTWGLYKDLRTALGDQPVSVTVEYWGKHFGIPRSHRLKASCTLEVFSFEANDASDRNYPKHIAESIKEVGKTLSKIAERSVRQ